MESFNVPNALRSKGCGSGFVYLKEFTFILKYNRSSIWVYLKRTPRVKNELFTKALSVVADVWSGIVMASSTQWNNYTASIRIYYQFLAPRTISWIHWSSASSIPLSPEGPQMRATGWPNKQSLPPLALSVCLSSWLLEFCKGQYVFNSRT